MCLILGNHDLVLVATNMFQNHLNIVYIKQREFSTVFSFINTNKSEVRKNIKKFVKIVKFQQRSVNLI